MSGQMSGQIMAMIDGILPHIEAYVGEAFADFTGLSGDLVDRP